MASRNILQIPRPYVFESDDSEEDLSFTGIDYQTMPLEDLIQELSGNCRNINNAELHNLCMTRINKKTKSKAVQTGPDSSGIPPSWILTGEMLVDELYTGISNVINTLYHHPFECHKQDATKVDCEQSVDIKCPPAPPESGCTIPRLSSMKPLFPRLDYQKLIVNSDEFKKKLCNLKDKATRLKGLIPYLDANVDTGPERSARKMVKIVKHKEQQTDFENISKCEHHGIKSSEEKCTSSSDFLKKLSNFSSAISIDDNASSHVEKKSYKRHSAEEHLQKTDSHKGMLKSAGGSKISRSWESVHIPPLRRHKLQQSEDESTKMNLAHAGKDRCDRTQGKDEKNSKETPFQGKNAASGSSTSCKNFIKRNILALKAQSGAASSSKSSSSASHDTQRTLPPQKKSEKKKK